MKSDKGLTYKMIGAALLIMAGVFLSLALSQPKLYIGAGGEGVSASVSVHTEQKADKKPTAPPTTKPEYPLNLNACTLEELMTIDGLGEKKASAIIEYRERLGKYTSVEQIMEIEGFGEETYRDIAGDLCV